MARWAPQETDTYAEIAGEVIAQVGTNRAVVGVDGQDGVDLERVAAGLVAGFARHGVSAMAAAAPSSDVDVLRSDVVTPFRTTGAGDGVLVVHGHGLLAPGARGLWRWSLWAEQETGRLERRADVKIAASAVLDVTDPDHPRREWNDAC
ncbi:MULTISPECIES: hypothetical protein [unclassified Curtobacterium]|uniref:hypothetical protein n=1 Tax=unclassified Curtobacterium TaxID=257496 RepID=UPI000825E64C|nr:MULTISPECIES: hypothetical protein [unclassified Curtobacterium]WIA98761.1 hypothetical protein QOL15_09330 [Curtobacterium sp. MCBA15_012]